MLHNSTRIEDAWRSPPLACDTRSSAPTRHKAILFTQKECRIQANSSNHALQYYNLSATRQRRHLLAEGDTQLAKYLVPEYPHSTA